MNHYGNTAVVQSQKSRILAARSAELPPTAKLLLRTLVDFMGKKAYAWPSIRSLAEEVGVTRRQIIRLIAKLVEAGYIATEARHRPDGSQASNRFVWTWGACEGHVTPPMTPAAHLEESKNNQVNNTHAANAGCDFLIENEAQKLRIKSPLVESNGPTKTNAQPQDRQSGGHRVPNAALSSSRSKRFIRIDSDRFKQSSHCLEIYDEAVRGRLVKAGTANRLTFVAAWIEVQRKFESGKVQDRAKLMRFLIGKPAVLAEYPTQSSEQRAHGVIKQFCQPFGT